MPKRRTGLDHLLLAESRPAPAGEHYAGIGDCLVVVTAYVNAQGHARVYHGGESLGAHRLAWQLEHGPVPEGMLVLHRCDVGACIRLAHLRVGTYQDNILDAVRRGRAHPYKGKGSRKPLTPTQV